MKKARVVLIILLFGLAAEAQTVRRPFIRSFGEGSVSVNPDQARIQFSVVTQAPTAEAAASQNATQVTALLAALRTVLGQNAEIKTISYSLNPNYSSGSQPVIVGYTASNSVEVIVGDLSLIGKVIDTGIQAGGNRVQGVQFGLKNDQPQRLEALKLATAQAKTHADAMASGLNLRTGAVAAIEEGFSSGILDTGLRAAAPTPIETGQVVVRATVTLEIEIAQ